MASMPLSVACDVQIHQPTMRNTIRFTAASLFAGALLAATAGAQTISIKGSDTLGAKLVPTLAPGALDYCAAPLVQVMLADL